MTQSTLPFAPHPAMQRKSSLSLRRGALYPVPCVLGLLATLALGTPSHAQSTVDSAAVEPQPFIAHVMRLDEALTLVGSSLQPEDRRRLAALRERTPSSSVVAEIERILDPYVLASVEINPESRVRVRRGRAEAELVQHGWKSFLVKVQNQGGVRAPLEVSSPNAAPLLHPTHQWETMNEYGGEEDHVALPENRLSAGEVANRFLEVTLFRNAPMLPGLSGQPLEYAIIQMYSKDAGAREVRLEFSTGPGTQDLAFRGAIDLLFAVRPAVRVRFRVTDADGSPTMASFIITDGVQRVPVGPNGLPLERRLAAAQNDRTGGVDQTDERPKRLVGIYPLPSRRLASADEYPDFYFQPQIYRADGEHVYLSPGVYEVEYTRGPEYEVQVKTIFVPSGVATHEETFQLKRWTDLSILGWYSGDHHGHAAGCSHYESPEYGVRPEDMWRQLVGEDVDVGSVLSWGPGWYHQKQFFSGEAHSLSTAETVMRYDVEVSGFPSSHSGHLALLGLKEDDYPGTKVVGDWPSWTLPILQWVRSQGGLGGYAHSGRGLAPVTPTTELPNYVLPRMDNNGANEYVATLAHDVIDFYSAGDTPAQWELNAWYHSLNAGFRPRLMGETDFPCLFDERVGMARTYAKITGPLTYEAFRDAARAGRSYVSDGKSHLIDFRANGLELGTAGSELRLSSAADVRFTARVSALLPAEEDSVVAGIAIRPAGQRPEWSILRSRIGKTRRVPVELIVNGYPVARQEIEADGSWQDVTFSYRVERSSWAALRILPSSHTNPIFIPVGGAPIRASRRSAQWLRTAVDQAWTMKSPGIRPAELDAARAGYDHARQVYDRIVAESPVE
jgi:hypothetical protein